MGGLNCTRLPGGTTLTARLKTLVATSVALILFIGVMPAFGVPTGKREAAKAVKAQVDTLDHQVEVAAEAYNEARAKHDGIKSRIASTQADLAKTNDRIGTLTTHLSVRAESMYRSGPMSFVEVLLGSKDFTEFATVWDVLKEMNRREAESVADLKKARAKAKEYEAELAKQETSAAKVVAQMAANKKSIEAKLAERKGALRGLESEIAALEAAEEARIRAAAQKSVSRASAKRFPAPTRAPRTEVVAIAKRYLGAPYRWGASGPNSFDCSGFTMFVYRQVGVSLPHSSRAQYGVGQKVSRSDLKPGDLVFFGSPIHHVGIYVGGGSYIHSPRTGDVVKISSVDRSDYAGASRP